MPSLTLKSDGDVPYFDSSIVEIFSAEGGFSIEVKLWAATASY